MNGDDAGPTGGSLMVWVLVALLVMALVFLVLFVRGPLEQDHATAPYAVLDASIGSVPR